MHELVQNRIIIRTLLNLNHYMTTPYAPYTGINDLKILEITPPESYLHYIVYNCRLPKTSSGVSNSVPPIPDTNTDTRRRYGYHRCEIKSGYR